MFHLLSAAETAQAEAPKAVQVAPHVPILYFGRLSEYEKSDLRIVTVGLNPSDIYCHESNLVTFEKVRSITTSNCWRPFAA